jgi:hypothetical protein
MCVSLRGCQQNRGKKKTRSITGGSLGIVCWFNSHDLPRPARGGREGCSRFEAWRTHETDLNFGGTVLQVNMPRKKVICERTLLPQSSHPLLTIGLMHPRHAPVCASHPSVFRYGFDA